LRPIKNSEARDDKVLGDVRLSQDLVRNWSRQWRLWDRLHFTPEFTRKTYEGFKAKFGLDPLDRAAAPLNVLDAGCGNGRNSALFADTQHKVWAVDLSESVEYARRNVQARNVTFLRGDLHDLPFPAGFFDFVFSDGVLIHVPDIRPAIQSLATKVRPGGTLALAMAKVFDPADLRAIRRERIIEFYRRFTVRMPAPALRIMVDALASLYHLRAVPAIGPLMFYFVPEWHPDPEWRKCYIHDYLSAVYRERQEPSRIVSILRELGFVDIQLADSHEVRVRAIKPAA
jgi:SAM-dependent methyltransferase